MKVELCKDKWKTMHDLKRIRKKQKRIMKIERVNSNR